MQRANRRSIYSICLPDTALWQKPPVFQVHLGPLPAGITLQTIDVLTIGQTINLWLCTIDHILHLAPRQLPTCRRRLSVYYSLQVQSRSSHWRENISNSLCMQFDEGRLFGTVVLQPYVFLQPRLVIFKRLRYEGEPQEHEIGSLRTNCDCACVEFPVTDHPRSQGITTVCIARLVSRPL